MRLCILMQGHYTICHWYIATFPFLFLKQISNNFLGMTVHCYRLKFQTELPEMQVHSSELTLFLKD